MDLISFNLFLAVHTCVDLATHLISDESWEPTATAREAFERLEEQGVISKETVLERFAAELSAWLKQDR